MTGGAVVDDSEAWDQLKRWQVTVDQRLEDGERRFENVEKLDDVRRKMLEENTAITQAIGRKVDTVDGKIDGLAIVFEPVKKKLDASVFPVVDGVETGLRIIGGIGKAGDWVVHRWLYILAGLIAAKVLWSGGSFSEAWNSSLRFLEVHK